MQYTGGKGHAPTAQRPRARPTGRPAHRQPCIRGPGEVRTGVAARGGTGGGREPRSPRGFVFVRTPRVRHLLPPRSRHRQSAGRLVGAPRGRGGSSGQSRAEAARVGSRQWSPRSRGLLSAPPCTEPGGRRVSPCPHTCQRTLRMAGDTASETTSGEAACGACHVTRREKGRGGIEAAPHARVLPAAANAW